MFPLPFFLLFFLFGSPLHADEKSVCFTVARVTAETLGKGGLGEVKVGINPAGKEVAVKTPGPKGSIAGLKHEAEMIALVAPHDPTGLFIRGAFDSKGNALVMEYPKGALPLLTWFGSSPSPSKETLASVAAQLKEAQRVLRLAKVVHGDLAPSNILVTPDGKIKIVDFGSATKLNEKRRKRYGHSGFASYNQENGGPASYLDDSFTLRRVVSTLDLYNEGLEDQFRD